MIYNNTFQCLYRILPLYNISNKFTNNKMDALFYSQLYTRALNISFSYKFIVYNMRSNIIGKL